MLNSEELSSLSKDARELQKQISDFINKEYSALSRLNLVSSIDKLLLKIKSQLRAPSNDEDNKVKLLIIKLGHIAENFKNLKELIEPNTLSTSTFFKLNKPQSALNQSQYTLGRLATNLNQLENSLESRISRRLTT